jgi:hypothetical protein
VVVLLNLYSGKKDVPDGVKRIGMNIIPDDKLLVQTNNVGNQPLTAIRSAVLVYHFQQFNHCHHGKLNVFAVQHKLDYVDGTLTPVLLESHMASSDSVHASALDYKSLPFLILRTCDRIASLVAALICRVAQSQLPMNVFRVFVHPGVWKMIKNNIQDNYHSTTHPFFIDQVEVRVKKKYIQFANKVLHLVTETVHTLPSHYIDRIKGYTNEHVSYFQRHVLGCMFDIGTMCPHLATDDDDAIHIGQRAVPAGARLNVLTHLPMELEYGVAISYFVRHGLDGFSILRGRASNSHHESIMRLFPLTIIATIPDRFL